MSKPTPGIPDPQHRDLTRRQLLRTGLYTAGGLAVGGGLLTACSPAKSGPAHASATGPLGPAIQQAEARLEAARAVPTFTAPGPAFDTSSVRGKKLFYLAITFNVQIVQDLFNGVKEAASTVGMSAVAFDAKGDPSLYTAGFDQAINQKVDCVILESIANGLVSGPMKRAQDAGIKVVMINEVRQSGPNIPRPDGYVAFDYVGGALLDADWVLADSGGRDINLVVFHAESEQHMNMANAIKQRIEASCVGTCKVKLAQVNYADFATRLPSLTQSLVTSDPKINYMIPVIDGMTLNIIPGLRQANAMGRVKIASYNGTQSVMKMLKANQGVGADAGGPHAWEGWLDVDIALRVLTGQHVPDVVKPPNRLFDAQNIGSINIDDSEATWYNTDAVKQQFRTLWGVK
jgi:ribose transport system substrate-binding protein